MGKIKMKLYELSQQYAQLIALLEDEDADVELIEGTIEAVEEAFHLKAENLAKVIRDFQSDADAIKEEAKRLAERSRAIEKKTDKLKEYLLQQMVMTNTDKIAGKFFTISTRKSTSVNVESLDQVPETFKNVKTEIVADKRAIAEALKNGEVIPGCTLNENKSLQIK